MLIKGKLIYCKREVKEFEGRKSEEKLYLTLAEAELTDEQKEKLREAFKDSGKKFTPDWIKDFKGYVNVSSKYPVAVRMAYENPIRESDSIEKEISDGLKWVGADVKLSINVKEGAIYPSAILMLTEGKAFNPFHEFDEE